MNGVFHVDHRHSRNPQADGDYVGAQQPWMKFYPRDWRGDQALRMCTIAARGLWIEMLCVMHEAQPYGYLTVNGRPLKDDDLARLAGTDLSTIQQAMAELEAAGVFSRDRNRVIYSRRMTRDEKRRKDGDKAAKGGTLPHSRRGSQLLDGQGVNAATPRVVEGAVNPPPSTQRPEDRSQTENKKEEVSKILASSSLALKPGKPWTAEQKKAAWQSKICVEACRRLTPAEYTAFLEAWANNEPKANNYANKLDRELRAAERRRTAA